jgi:hypothetical protein
MLWAFQCMIAVVEFGCADSNDDAEIFMPTANSKPLVLILCTGNSCRSHLAEDILRAVAGDSLNAQSAGSKPAGVVHPLAIQVMKEIGIDISAHRPPTC